MKELKKLEYNYRNVLNRLKAYFRGEMVDLGYYIHLTELRLKYYNKLKLAGFKPDYNI